MAGWVHAGNASVTGPSSRHHRHNSFAPVTILSSVAQAKPLASPASAAPGRTEEDLEAVAAARSTSSAEDQAAVGKKGQGGDKPASVAGESSCHRKEPQQLQQQHAAPLAKLLSQCSQSPRPIGVPQFLVGQNKRCNLLSKDQPVSKHIEQGGLCELEVIGDKEMVQLNGNAVNPRVGREESDDNVLTNGGIVFSPNFL